MNKLKKTLTIDPAVVEAAIKRSDVGELSSIVSRDLARLYKSYQYALANTELSVDEACYLVDILNGTIVETHTAGMLWASVEDAAQLDGTDKKWNIDAKALAEKLKGYTHFQNLAIADAAERFWTGNKAKTDLKKRVKEIFGPAVK